MGSHFFIIVLNKKCEDGLSIKDKALSVLYSRYHGCGWYGDARSQTIIKIYLLSFLTILTSQH